MGALGKKREGGREEGGVEGGGRWRGRRVHSTAAKGKKANSSLLPCIMTEGRSPSCPVYHAQPCSKGPLCGRKGWSCHSPELALRLPPCVLFEKRKKRDFPFFTHML